jgi:hypothetical protein
MESVMSETQHETLPEDLSAMLPVGMISGGGLAIQALAAVAQRKRGVAGWEAFHYEKVTGDEFEVTGGIAVTIAGVRKFQGAHDTVMVSEAEVMAELRSRHQPAAPATVMSLLEQDMLVSDIGQTSNSHAGQRYLKVVFALPEDEAGRQRLLQAFRLQASFLATVQACSLHDHHPL